MNRILNRLNWVSQHTDPKTNILTVPGETLFGESETIPGQGITPREIVTRYINGKTLPNLQGVFTDNQYLPDNFERMDKVDKSILAYQMLAIVADRQQKMAARRALPRQAPTQPDEEVPSPATTP